MENTNRFYKLIVPILCLLSNILDPVFHKQAKFKYLIIY